MVQTKELFLHDVSFLREVSGCDEAGRGPLAGPLVVAACIMPLEPSLMIDGINDSKKLSEKCRNEIYKKIISVAKSYKISIIDVETINKVNILNATKLGMEEAIMGLSIPSLALVDAVNLNIQAETVSIVRGDLISYNIAAASILAKVTRDSIMLDYDKAYPVYGFKSHKGYGTARHIDALKKSGACPIHRTAFVKNFI